MSVTARRSLEELHAERDFLLASLADLDREHAAGDIDEDDYATLRAGYVARAGMALREIELFASADASSDGDPAPQAGPATLRGYLGRRGVRRGLVAVGVICFAGLLLVLATRLTGVRLPFEQATGSVNQPSAVTIRDDLAQASVLGSSGQLERAVVLYQAVLALAPDQPEALAYEGWLIRLAGLQKRSTSTVKSGDQLLARAVDVAPGYSDARAFYGLALLQDDNALTGSLKQFRAFLEDHPSSSLEQAVAPNIGRAFRQAHEVVPPAIARYLH